MQASGLRVLIGTPSTVDGDTVEALLSALAADGHTVCVVETKSPRSKWRLLCQATPGGTSPRPDLLVLPPRAHMTTALARLTRIPVLPLPPRASDADHAGAIVRRVAGLAETRMKFDLRPLVVAVPTYRRNAQLQELLPILENRLDEVRDLTIERRILVADNDPDAGAATVVAQHRGHPNVPVDYLRVHVPGVAASRNACLDAARSGELLAFIDDDQIPRPGWLRHLLLARQRTGADAVAGPARPVYPVGTPAWIEAGPFHDTPRLPRDRRVSLSTVTNFLLDVDVARRLGLSFPDIGTRGGEDSWFTTMLARRGALITWEPGAVVDEAVPPPRTRPRWVLTRSLGNGVIAGRLGARSGGAGPPLTARLRQTAGGTARIAAGTARAAFGLARHSPAAMGAGLHTTFRGLGMALGAWDLVFDEYARAGDSRWRVDHDPEM